MLAKIETTMQALLNAEPALQRLGQIQLPVKAAYAVMKLAVAVMTETKYFHGERDKLIKALGVERPDGQTEVTSENRGEFFAKINELSALPITLDRELLGFALLDGTNISAGDLLALSPLLQMPDADQPEKPAKLRRVKAGA